MKSLCGEGERKMKYEMENPRSIKVTIRQWQKSYKKIGDIIITPSAVYWKFGTPGTYKKHYVSMDDFIEWMNDRPTR